MENTMSEGTGQKHTNKIQLESISSDPIKINGGFYAHFQDGLDIQYEPRGALFNSKKKTLWIQADPDEVDICFFHGKFELGFNTTNETGAWLSLTDGKLAYNKAVVSKLHGYVEDPYDEDEHLACRNFPNCNEVGCGEW